MRYFPHRNIIGQKRYLVRVPLLRAGCVVRTYDHQSIKEFTSIKNKMTITPVIYCRVNIYRQIRGDAGHSTQLSASQPAHLPPSNCPSQYYNIEPSTSWEIHRTLDSKKVLISKCLQNLDMEMQKCSKRTNKMSPEILLWTDTLETAVSWHWHYISALSWSWSNVKSYKISRSFLLLSDWFFVILKPKLFLFYISKTLSMS